MDNSCIGCKFLCKQDSGYSNYTVEETEVFCALNNNPNLPAVEPYNWTTGGGDQWKATNKSRCPSYRLGEAAYFDVDREVTVEDFRYDPELYNALILGGYK